MIKYLLLVSLFFHFLDASTLQFSELINIVFNKSNTLALSLNNDIIFTHAKTFRWQPSKKFLKKLPRDIRHNYNNFTIKLLDKFYSKDKSTFNILFTLEYDTCHACAPLILGASINITHKKIQIPLTYITQIGNSGDLVVAENIALNKHLNGVFLHGSFIAQGYTAFRTKLIVFSDKKIIPLLSFIEKGQLFKCSITSVKTSKQINMILKNDIARKIEIIKNDFSNEVPGKNGNVIYESSFCDLFIKTFSKNMPTIFKYMTSFKKTIDKNKKENISYEVDFIQWKYKSN